MKPALSYVYMAFLVSFCVPAGALVITFVLANMEGQASLSEYVDAFRNPVFLWAVFILFPLIVGVGVGKNRLLPAGLLGRWLPVIPPFLFWLFFRYSQYVFEGGAVSRRFFICLTGLTVAYYMGFYLGIRFQRRKLRHNSFGRKLQKLRKESGTYPLK